MTMRFADVILCFPPILLAMLVAGFLGGGVGYLILIIGFLYLPQFSRLAFAQTLAVRQAESVEAARASGASPVRILLRAILPNVVGPLVIQASLSAASAMLLESGLSFLGLGVLPPAPPWGARDRDCPELHVPDPLLRAMVVAGAERDDPWHQHDRRRPARLPRSLAARRVRVGGHMARREEEVTGCASRRHRAEGRCGSTRLRRSSGERKGGGRCSASIRASMLIRT
ncbi:MAG TPA: ABC transporter permease [bacterium]|nr:ABC transporter permease [bacterium]